MNGKKLLHKLMDQKRRMLIIPPHDRTEEQNKKLFVLNHLIHVGMMIQNFGKYPDVGDYVKLIKSQYKEDFILCINDDRPVDQRQDIFDSIVLILEKKDYDYSLGNYFKVHIPEIDLEVTISDNEFSPEAFRDQDVLKKRYTEAIKEKK